MRSVVGEDRLLVVFVIGQNKLLFVLPVIGKHGFLFAFSVVCKHRTSFIGKHLLAAGYRLCIPYCVIFMVFGRISVGKLELLGKRVFLTL